jgi:membrane-associated protease RseP (regulator of RpoE activity)
LIPKPDPELRARRIAAVLFGVTGVVVYLAAVLWWWESPLRAHPEVLWRAAVFTLALLGFLSVHEAGHWLTAKAHGIRLGPPLFLPIGVVMRLREVPGTRSGLLEMGAMGPLAGVGAIAAMLMLHFAVAAPVEGAGSPIVLAAPPLWSLVGLIFTGAAPAAPTALDPLALAACFGCLITVLNLLPWGQLDGGHVAAALFPSRAGVLSWGITAVLLLGGFWWPGWAVWAALIHLVGTRHPLRARKDREPPSTRARWIAAAAVVAFILCFAPGPVRLG